MVSGVVHRAVHGRMHSVVSRASHGTICSIAARTIHRASHRTICSIVFHAIHKEIMILIQIISRDVQRFTETLKMHDFPFSQKTQRCKDIGIVRQVDEIFICAAGLLFCGTFGSVIWEVL